MCTGPHLGVCYDGHIWYRTARQKLLPWEQWIGDGAYIANAQFITPYRKPNNGVLSPDQVFVNDIISHYRARVEHINHLMEFHAVLQGMNIHIIVFNMTYVQEFIYHSICYTLGKFRGGVGLLSDCYRVIAHTTNIHLRAHPRYPPFGSWPHSPV